MKDEQKFLNAWPKQRPPLPPKNQACYEKEYAANRQGASFFSRISTGLEGWMHRQVARHESGNARILELGAGTLNHLAYESRYQAYDVVEPFDALFANSPNLAKVSDIYADIEEIDTSRRYDRIISVAVLEHLTDLPAIVHRAACLLAPDGVFQAGIPAEGGMLWGLSWRCTTGLAYRARTGASYKALMQHEHINDAWEIQQVLQYYFKSVQIRRFFLPWRHFALYEYIEARQPLLKNLSGESATNL